MAKAAEIVRGGRLGQLVAVVGTEMFYKPEQYFEDGPWRRQPGAADKPVRWRTKLRKRIFDELGRKHDGSTDWDDLIVITVEDQCRNVDLLA